MLKNLLYLDDNIHNLSLYTTIFETYDPEVNIFTSLTPKDFFNIVNREEIGLYLIDFNLDDTNGYEIWLKLREKINSPEVIIITAGILEEVDQYFSKESPKPLIMNRFTAIEKIKEHISEWKKPRRKYDITTSSEKINMPPEKLSEIINYFAEDFEKNIKTILVKEIHQKNYKNIYKHFHKMKSSLSLFSADEAVLICKVACDKSYSSIDYDYGVLLNNLEHELKLFLAEVLDYQKTSQ